MAPGRTFVISDLHLGGRPDAAVGGTPYQICHSYAELAEFVRWVATQCGEGSVELVINGDIVDFLAEDGAPGEAQALAWDPSEEQVLLKLDRIVERTRNDGDGPFDALREFSTARRRLVLILGNHDVELSLPCVRRHLVGLLTSPSGHVPTIVFDGEAHLSGRVLIEHGNRYDDWNVVNHSALREDRSVMSRGDGKVSAFKPPAGSHLVVDVINKLKSTYRFIDLLKPERDAVVPLLLALMPSLRSPLALVAGFATNQSRKLWQRTNPIGQRGKLSSEGSKNSVVELGDDAALEQLLARFGFAEPEVAGPLPSRKRRKLSSLSKDIVVSEPRSGQATPLWERSDAVVADLRDRFLAALTTNTWDAHQEEPEYLEAVGSILETGCCDVVVFGHTHLPKRIEVVTRNGRKGLYLNTGTWADVIRVPAKELLDGPEGMAQTRSFIRRLLTDEIATIRTRILTYAEIVHEAGGDVDAQVRSYCGPGRERSPVLTEYPSSSQE